MASDYVAPSQAFRVFMLQEICQHLTPSDVESLLYTNQLPMPDLTESSKKVLMKLEMRDMFSASNITPLAHMMQNIQRNDLAKKVEKFQKSKNKKEHKKKERCAAVDAHMLQKCQITASITTIKLQTKILLEQIEELKSTASKMGCTEVEKVIRDAIEIIEVQFQEKLQLASSKLPQLRQDSVDSLDSPPSSLSSSEGVLDTQSPMGTLESGPRPRSGAVSKTRSLPRDFTTALKKPLLPPSISTQASPPSISTQVQDLQPDDHDYEYVTPGSFSPVQSEQLHYSSTDIAPSSRQDESRGHLVTGRDSPAQPSRLKPTVAPKPSKLQSSTATSSSDYTGGSADTSTADSGFVDSEKFRKERPPPRPLPRHNYTPLKAEQRDTVDCYATPEPQDAEYDEVGKEDLYVNIAR